MQYEDVKTPQELYNFMKENIKYGFVSKIDNKIYRRDLLQNDELYDEMFEISYYPQTPEEVLRSKCALCFDQVELERDWFVKHGYPVHTYFSDYHNHAFLIFEENNKYYLFDRSFYAFNGIHEADTLEGCINIYKEKQIAVMDRKVDVINLYKFEHMPFGEIFPDAREGLINDSTQHIALEIKTKQKTLDMKI